MEFSLHQQLKSHYAPRQAATEVTLGRFRIDAVKRNGELVEIQVASLSAIRRKVEQLLAEGHRLRVVKPIISKRKIIRQETEDGPVVSSRWSPKRGDLLDVFNELIYFTRIFPHPRLVIETPVVEVEEWRLPLNKRRRRRFSRNYRLKDVTLQSIHSTLRLRDRRDLWRLVKGDGLPMEFGTQEIAQQLQRPRWMAQRIAYCLRQMGIVEPVGRKKQGWLYRAA